MKLIFPSSLDQLDSYVCAAGENFKFRISVIDDEVKTFFSVQLNPVLWALDHARLLSG